MDHPNLSIIQVKQFQVKLYKIYQIKQGRHAINCPPQAPPTKACLGAPSVRVLRLT
jgi:hypothetical protein